MLRVALSAVLLLSKQGYAESFLSELVPVKTVLDTAECKGEECGCAQFDGSWVGACSIDGKEDAKTVKLFVVQKGCSHIVINHDVLAIGGQKTGTLTIAGDSCGNGSCSKSITGSGVSSADWNRNKSILTVSTHSGVRELGGDGFWHQMSATLKRQSGHFLIDAKGSDSTAAEHTVSCSFEK